MKKQLAIMTASLVLAATLAGCAQPAQRSAAHMNYIGADAAKNMAAADAQVDTANASFSGANLGEKNGLSYYQVDFTANGREYHYAIDAMTGTVIESSSAASAQQTTGTGQQAATAGQQAAAAGQVDENQAKQIALDHAGVAESDTSFLWVKPDYEDGVAVYEVEFYVASTNTEYDYEIEAATGSIRGYDYDAENYRPGQQGVTGETKSEQEIRDIALAKVPGATEKDIRLKLDHDDGRLLYEGKIVYQGMEYEFEIDAYSGAIQEWDAESIFD